MEIEFLIFQYQYKPINPNGRIWIYFFTFPASPVRLLIMSSTDQKAMTDEAKQHWREIVADYDRTIKTYTTMSALHSLAQHWVENELIIERAATEEAENNRPDWTPDHNNEAEIAEFCAERDTARYVHDKIMIPMHRYSCVVMLYATVERELRRLIENLEKERGPQKLQANEIRERSYLAQVGKFVDVFHGILFADCPHYVALNDLQKIRDC